MPAGGNVLQIDELYTDRELLTRKKADEPLFVCRF